MKGELKVKGVVDGSNDVLDILIRPILGSLEVYYFSTFKDLKKIICKLEGIRGRFFWSGSSNENKISWIASVKVTSPRSKGGLGIVASFHPLYLHGPMGGLVKETWITLSRYLPEIALDSALVHRHLLQGGLGLLGQSLTCPGGGQFVLAMSPNPKIISLQSVALHWILGGMLFFGGTSWDNKTNLINKERDEGKISTRLKKTSRNIGRMSNNGDDGYDNQYCSLNLDDVSKNDESDCHMHSLNLLGASLGITLDGKRAHTKRTYIVTIYPS
ncbi:reverse transcriptase domain, Reverse transcriptase zinc-binding domain protein [Artemisia annua]|uniref:Reverse transcriptase domain, Reverse transcriptase zinc-binding domain protein n=1 Tax=Artemisia annua TaxID=35608 RepID=A0A2U1NJ27_ARTAN|nr:reverse transcriptase domain, Reverse transcriptase zinc-binding domain protein [Artemisia annua]